MLRHTFSSVVNRILYGVKSLSEDQRIRSWAWSIHSLPANVVFQFRLTIHQIRHNSNDSAFWVIFKANKHYENLYFIIWNKQKKLNLTTSTTHLPPTKVFRRLTGSVNKTMLKAHLAAVANTPTYTSDFPDVKFRVAALKWYRRKQSGSGIRTIIRIGLKSK